jgi:hypothetical protein
VLYTLAAVKNIHIKLRGIVRIMSAFRKFEVNVFVYLSHSVASCVQVMLCEDFLELHKKGKGKAVPLQAWSGPEGSRKLRFSDFLTTAQYGGKVFSPTHRPPLPPGNAPCTHFCEKLSRPQGHSAIGRIMSTEKSNDTTWD